MEIVTGVSGSLNPTEIEHGYISVALKRYSHSTITIVFSSVEVFPQHLNNYSVPISAEVFPQHLINITVVFPSVYVEVHSLQLLFKELNTSPHN